MEENWASVARAPEKWRDDSSTMCEKRHKNFRCIMHTIWLLPLANQIRCKICRRHPPLMGTSRSATAMYALYIQFAEHWIYQLNNNTLQFVARKKKEMGKMIQRKRKILKAGSDKDAGDDDGDSECTNTICHSHFRSEHLREIVEGTQTRGHAWEMWNKYKKYNLKLDTMHKRMAIANGMDVCLCAAVCGFTCGSSCYFVLRFRNRVSHSSNASCVNPSQM